MKFEKKEGDRDCTLDYEDMLKTLSEQCLAYGNGKNWTASFKRGKSNCAKTNI